MTKRTALVTGASTGIGYELAHILCADGFDVALVARDEQRLATVAAELKQKYGREAKIIVADLSKPDAPRLIFDQLQRENFSVSVLINNAGAGVYGAFADTELDRDLAVLRLNMESVVALTKLFLKPMLARREGKILNVASVAAYQPDPLLGIYGATKAFVLSFSAALSVELKNTGVTVTAISPGTTSTEFHKRAGLDRSGLMRHGMMKAMSPRSVAEIGFRAMMAGKPIVIPGLMNRILAGLSKCSPMMLSAKVAGRLNAKSEMSR
jgi:short-subunit dehydrogenase